MNKQEHSYFVFARVAVVACLLAAAVHRFPIGYYTFLRFAVCGVCWIGAIVANKEKQLFWACMFGLIALLFNPIFRVYQSSGAWQLWDIAAAVAVGMSVFLFRGVPSNLR